MTDSIWGGPAFEAGLVPGMKVVGVNGRVYTRDLLEDAIADSPKTAQPIVLLAVNDDYYVTCTIDYHGGPRYPHLERASAKADYLDELIKPKR